ncbi:PAS domain S-box protein [Noviherbaspirillum sp.]|jgi:diguanylate cyclase (GGDEF)-like protein/PAS domain S-box-containing protein|uniref:sensor domain-containing protein n=1 Tax=Noviherbaspirillum sp. TaxID=1926288 RepID=UPI0025EB235A|nr:PAS domain S-box protein [Noviherbaspirillum sp.]
MKLLFQEASQAEQLYRLIIDNAVDAFIATDQDNRIIEWSKQAERIFGWSRQEVAGSSLTDTLIPPRHRAAHERGLQHYLESGEGELRGSQVELPMRCKDGREIPVELTVTPIIAPDRTIFFASLRDISQRKALEEEVHRQAYLTTSILNSMAAAVAVADLSGRLIMVNPAGQRLLNMEPLGPDNPLSFYALVLLQPDGKTPYLPEQMPAARALAGEHVDGVIAFLPGGGPARDGVWLSINARPLLDGQGVLAGGVVVLHDITEQRQREQALASQARQLQEQASLLDLAHDAILARTTDDVITYWNRSAEKLYQYKRAEAIGQVSHDLLKTRFPQALDEILAIVRQQHYWEGEVIHTARDGRELIVFSQWALDFHEGRPYRFLETNTDITHQVETERALKQSQQHFRLLVEASTDYAIMTTDPAGNIMSWNAGAERILGLSATEAIGLPIASLFTSEDRDMGEPMRELGEARAAGRSEDDRWHLRQDGTRFWATGVVTPLHNPDGSLRGFVKIMRDQTEQRLVAEQTYFLANHDALTGLPNRINFSNQLHQSIALSRRNDVPLALLLLDLDRFKHVNDTFGHHAGDLLLKEVALRISSTLRETDFVARLGGDEFVVIQADTSQPEAADTLARKLILELGRPYRLDSHEIISGTSIGICVSPKDGKNSVELLKRADLALYRAKEAGRHTYQFYTADLVSRQTWKRDRETALRGALKNHQFELYYQPLVDLAKWNISSVEALLRWNASEMETVLPGEFLEIIEQSGLIVEVGEWALREACHQVRQWQARGLSDLRLSINFSARQFNEPQFVALIPSILRDAGIAPAHLELEVPEAMLGQHPEIKEQLTELRALGIRLVIDNFGTGTTALIDFKDFRIDVLKIDKAFVQHLPHRREDSAITSAIISLAHDLGIGVSAGGVETAEQLAYLKARNCTSAQGFIFSPPLPAAQFEAMIMDGSLSRINRMPNLGDVVGSKGLH